MSTCTVHLVHNGCAVSYSCKCSHGWSLCMGQSCSDRYRAKMPTQPIPHPMNMTPESDPPIVEFNDNLGAPVQICGFDASLNNSIDISFTLDQITNVQHALYDFDRARSKELYDSFGSDGIDYRSDLIYATTVLTVTKPFHPFACWTGTSKD